MAKVKNGVVAALDVGTSKISCFVARIDGGGVRVVGIGHQPAAGMRAGNVVDVDAATRAISTAVSAAEEMCGETVREVIVGLGCGQPASHNQSLETQIGHHEIGERDVHRLLSQIHLPAETGDRALLHRLPVGFSVDGMAVQQPRGMYGERLSVDVHLVTAQTTALRNLENCIRRAHLDVADRVVTAYASGLACLVQDERELGATLVDMGGGTTSIAVFYEGHLVHCDSIPIGGAHVTKDIATCLSTPPGEADRMKTQFGRAVDHPNDRYDIIDVPLLGEENRIEPNHVPRSILVGIIRPRIEETFELVRSRLEASGLDRLAGERCVLTGGASQLEGVGDIAAKVLRKKVRLGAPLRMPGLAEATGGAAFSACAGLLVHAVQTLPAPNAGNTHRSEAPSGRFGRFGSWIRDNF